MTAGSEFESCPGRFHGPDTSAGELHGRSGLMGSGRPLVEGLKRESPGVQEAVMARSSRIGGARVVASLVRSCARIPSPKFAIEVLNKPAAAALDLLLPHAPHSDANLRKFIVYPG